MQKPIIRVPDLPGSSDPVVQPTKFAGSRSQGIQSNLRFNNQENIPLDPFSRQTALIRGGVVGSAPLTPEAPPHTPNSKVDSTPTDVAAADPATANSANWSTSTQAMLDQPPSALPRRLILGGMVFCLAFGAWAWLGQIEEVAKARGQLVPKGSVYKIHPIDLGKVAVVAVKEGQEVKAGQVLVELDSQITANDVERLQQALAADRSQLSEMQALIDRKRLEAQAQAEAANAASQAQKAAIVQSQASAATTQALLTQLQVNAVAQETQLARSKPLTGTSQALLAQTQANVAAHKARIARLKPLVKEGAISKEHLFEAEQALRDSQSAIARTKLGESASAKDQLFELQQALRDRQSDLIKSRGELQQTLAESAQLQAGLTQKQAEGQTIQLETQQQIQQLEVEMNQLKAKIAQNQTLLNDAQARLNQQFLRAPVNGVVMSLKIPKAGEVVQPGQMVAEVAPNNVPLTLSAALPNQEAGLVKIGMPVQIKLDAYPYQDYGVVPGKVTSISPNAQLDEQLGAVYRVDVSLDRDSVTANNQTIKFKAGQTANAEIIVRRHRVADVLLDPFKQLQKGGINL